MFVRVRRLRRAGRRIPGEQAHAPEHQVIGDLESVGGKFALRRHLSNDDASDVLFDARVVAILAGVGGMLLRGFEEYRGAAVLQEWEVTPLEQIIGPDGHRRWNWER